MGTPWEIADQARAGIKWPRRHRHVWHLDLEAKTIVCKTCGLPWCPP